MGKSYNTITISLKTTYIPAVIERKNISNATPKDTEYIMTYICWDTYIPNQGEPRKKTKERRAGFAQTMLGRTAS